MSHLIAELEVLDTRVVDDGWLVMLHGGTADPFALIYTDGSRFRVTLDDSGTEYETFGSFDSVLDFLAVYVQAIS